MLRQERCKLQPSLRLLRRPRGAGAGRGACAADTDGDGTPDAFDRDTDGDGYSDAGDPEPTNPAVPASAAEFLVVSYDFNEGAGTTVNNAADGGTAVPLTGFLLGLARGRSLAASSPNPSCDSFGRARRWYRAIRATSSVSQGVSPRGWEWRMR